MPWKRSPSLFTLVMIIILCIGACEAMSQDSAKTADKTTWTDSATGLTWTVKDSGSAVSPNEAGNYCSRLRAGGFSDWRLPTIDELEAMFDSKLKKENKTKGPIELSDPCILSGTTNSAGTWIFCFNSGGRNLGGGSGCGTTGHVMCTRGPAK
jgi:hypothetical protein